MSELQALIQWISDLLSEYLFAGVFIAALIETIIPPIPTMAVFPTAGFIASQNGLSVIEAVFLGIIGGLFVLETVSVIIQVISFKLTGKRVFMMAPLHHHFEKKGWAESTVVIRFWIISIILALIGLATLKLR